MFHFYPKDIFERIKVLAKDERISDVLDDTQTALLHGMSDHYRKLEQKLVFYFHTADINRIAELSVIAFDRVYGYGKKYSFLEDKLIVDAYDQFKGAINSLTGNYPEKSIRFFGLSVASLSELECLERVGRDLKIRDRNTKQRKARQLVSKRKDQILKKPFIDFCKAIVAKNDHINIRTFNDLLNVEGYDPEVTKVGERTIRGWAREAGITFKPGAPKKNNHA